VNISNVHTKSIPIFIENTVKYILYLSNINRRNNEKTPVELINLLTEILH